MVGTIGVHCLVSVFTALPKPNSALMMCPLYLKMAKCIQTILRQYKKMIMGKQSNMRN